MNEKLLELARALHRLARYSEQPGFPIQEDPLGQWVKREDVLRLVDAAFRGEQRGVFLDGRRCG